MKDFISTKNAGARRKQGMSADYDFKSVMVVASAWLLLYIVMLNGLLHNRGRDLLASVSGLLAQN